MTFLGIEQKKSRIVNFLLWEGRDKRKEENKQRERRRKNEWIAILEAWDTFILTQAIKDLMLVT